MMSTEMSDKLDDSFKELRTLIEQKYSNPSAKMLAENSIEHIKAKALLRIANALENLNINIKEVDRDIKTIIRVM